MKRRRSTTALMPGCVESLVGTQRDDLAWGSKSRGSTAQCMGWSRWCALLDCCARQRRGLHG